MQSFHNGVRETLSDMKIFITGATGYIGGAVADALLAGGHELAGLARSEESALKLERRNIRVVRGEMKDLKTVAVAAGRADAVVHAAWDGDDSRELELRLIDTVLNALKGTGKAFLYTSSVSVTGNTKAGAGDEESPYDPPSLGTWRAQAEKGVLDGAAMGIRTIVIRPAWVYGHGGGPVTMLIDAARLHDVVHFPGTGENRLPWVHIDDLASLYVLALGKAKPGSLFIGASGPSYRIRDLAEFISRTGKAAGRTEAVPIEEAKLRTEPFLGARVEGFLLDQEFTGAKARHLLGWNPQGASLLDELATGLYAARRENHPLATKSYGPVLPRSGWTAISAG